jgi:hypothetical protein
MTDSSTSNAIGPVLCVVGARPNFMKMALLVFVQHPRTRKNIERFGLASLIDPRRMLLLPPQGCLEMPGLIDELLGGRGKRGRLPEFWDGRAAERIASDLAQWLAEPR